MPIMESLLQYACIFSNPETRVIDLPEQDGNSPNLSRMIGILLWGIE